MRVLLVSYRFPPDTVGGVERYTEGLAAELVKAGHFVAIVARRTEPGKANIRLLRERLKDGTSLYRIIGPDVRFDRFLENHDQLDRLFVLAMLEVKPDIVHINHVIGFSPQIVRIAHQLGAAVVLSLHDFHFACPRIHLQKPSGDICAGPDFGRECATTCFPAGTSDNKIQWGLRATYFRMTLGAAQAVVAYSDYVASYFRNFVAAAKEIHIVPNAVPPEFSPDDDASAFADEGTLNIAYCGTVTPHKGPHVLIEALRFAQLKSANVFLMGHAPQRDYMKSLRERAAAAPRLTLKVYGKYERRELPILLRGMQCVVVPSLVPEAGPIVPREALACGVPVIASRLGALPEVIREGENGFTFDPRRPADLAEILRRIASDSTLLNNLRAGARSSPTFTIAQHADRIQQIYDGALQDLDNYPINRVYQSEQNWFHEALVRLAHDSSRVAAKPQGAQV